LFPFVALNFLSFTAKVDLQAGETLDGLGGYHTYGQCENADVVSRDNLLPMGLAEGCRLKRPVTKDQVLTYDDVELPGDRVAHGLRVEQNHYFASSEVSTLA